MVALGCILVLLHASGVTGVTAWRGDMGRGPTGLPPRDGSAMCHRGEVLAGQRSSHRQGKGAWHWLLEKLLCVTKTEMTRLPGRGRSSSVSPVGSAGSGPSCLNHLYPQTDPSPLGGPQDGSSQWAMGRGVCALGHGASLGAATRHRLGPGGWDSRAQVRRWPEPQRPCAQPGLLGSRGKWPELEGAQVPGVGTLL